MGLEHWIAFVLACVVLLAIPGPTVLLIISYALGHGRRPALALVTGVALGDLTAMTLSMVGLGAMLAASSTAFTGLRWVGAAYLVFMGIKLWRTPVRPGPEADGAPVPAGRMLAHAWLVTVLNPKGIIFFVAFVPQFLDATRPFWPQVVIVEVTFVILSAVNSMSYALAASAARRLLRSVEARRAINRTGGSLLVGAGLFAAAWRGANA